METTSRIFIRVALPDNQSGLAQRSRLPPAPSQRAGIDSSCRASMSPTTRRTQVGQPKRAIARVRCLSWPRRVHSKTRRTVLWIVPQSSAAARKLPLYADRMSDSSLAVLTMGSLGVALTDRNTVDVQSWGTSRWHRSVESGDYSWRRTPADIVTGSRTLGGSDW
jgi:hypothetical protein